MNRELLNGVVSYRKMLLKLSEEDPQFLINELYGIRGEVGRRLNDLFLELEASKKMKGINKGKILESISDELFLSTQIYNNKLNIRDSSNEIDVLVNLNNIGQIESEILPDIMKSNNQIIIECKNYNKKIGVTWIGKFHSLLRNRNKNFGIIFSYYPLAGKGKWDSAKGLVKKIYLKDSIAIINICKDDINKIVKNGKCIVHIIEEKYNELVYQTDIEGYISKHPAEK
ncbi:hypothetical protein [Clostridium paraputrificum]|uniref:hypothetical protein n=1 Tax=Clostridium paraputrificum TaxID=29363 RepID=UPI002FCDCFDC